MTSILNIMLNYYRSQIEDKRAILVINETDPQNLSTHVMYELPESNINDSCFSKDVEKAWTNYNPTQGIIIITVNTKTPKTTMQIKHFPWLSQDEREKLCMKCGMKHELVSCPDITEENREKLLT